MSQYTFSTFSIKWFGFVWPNILPRTNTTIYFTSAANSQMMQDKTHQSSQQPTEAEIVLLEQ